MESLKGKTARKTPQVIEDITRVNIPDTLKDLHPHVNISADYFFVQGIAFLHSTSRGYDFRTTENIKDFGKEYNKAKCSQE